MGVPGCKTRAPGCETGAFGCEIAGGSAEVYPTAVRTTAMGVLGAAGRLGSASGGVLKGANDWFIMRIYPRVLRLIGPS
eukprot:1177324-Prorocentrum_minimum.AAC.3